MIRIRVDIHIDHHKCPAPRDCRICLSACPKGVFLLNPKSWRLPGKKASGWAILPVYKTECDGCRICVGKCPNAAISIIIT